jgi:hypothetical protein
MLHAQYGIGRGTHYLCKHGACKQLVEEFLMQSFRQVVTDVYDKNYNDYFKDGEILSFFYCMPEGTEDTAERKVMIVLITVSHLKDRILSELGKCSQGNFPDFNRIVSSR